MSDETGKLLVNDDYKGHEVWVDRGGSFIAHANDEEPDPDYPRANQLTEYSLEDIYKKIDRIAAMKASAAKIKVEIPAIVVTKDSRYRGRDKPSEYVVSAVTFQGWNRNDGRIILKYSTGKAADNVRWLLPDTDHMRKAAKRLIDLQVIEDKNSTEMRELKKFTLDFDRYSYGGRRITVETANKQTRDTAEALGHPLEALEAS